MSNQQLQDMHNSINSMNLLFEQTSAYVKQAYKDSIQEMKLQCFDQSQNGQEFAKCTMKKVQQLEDSGKIMKFRLMFLEKKMEECFRASTGVDIQGFDKCSNQIKTFAQQIQDRVVTEQADI